MAEALSRVEAARRAVDLVGIPYRHLGRDRHGIDCIGVMLCAYGLADEDVPEIVEARQTVGYFTDRRWYARRGEMLRQNAELLASILTKHLVPISWAEHGAGDIVVMNFKTPDRRPDHVGICDGVGGVVHADMRSGVRRDPLDSFDGKVIGFYRRF